MDDFRAMKQKHLPSIWCSFYRAWLFVSCLVFVSCGILAFYHGNSIVLVGGMMVLFAPIKMFRSDEINPVALMSLAFLFVSMPIFTIWALQNLTM